MLANPRRRIRNKLAPISHVTIRALRLIDDFVIWVLVLALAIVPRPQLTAGAQIANRPKRRWSSGHPSIGLKAGVWLLWRRFRGE